MDLIPHSFLKSALVSQLPAIDFCDYQGQSTAGFQKFKCRRGEENLSLLTASIIRKEEEFVWKSCEELLSRTLKEAAQMLQGFFGFDLLSIQMGDSLRAFQWNHLRQLIVNHARTLQTGEEKLIQYTSLFGILKKRMPETWGKIEFQVPVKNYRHLPEELDLLIKKILKEGDSLGENYEILLQDFSSEPLFRFGEENQTLRIEKLLKNTKAKKELPLLYIQDSRGLIELGAQFGMRDHV